jgi:hypothetical protein
MRNNAPSLFQRMGFEPLRERRQLRMGIAGNNGRSHAAQGK